MRTAAHPPETREKAHASVARSAKPPLVLNLSAQRTTGVRWGTFVGAWLVGAAATYAWHGQDVRAAVFSFLALATLMATAFGLWRLVAARSAATPPVGGRQVSSVTVRRDLVPTDQ